MCEQTYGSLCLAGTITSHEDARMLADAINHYGGRVDGQRPSIPVASGIMPTHFSFDDLTGGVMPKKVREVIETIGLSYLWTHGQTSGYGGSGHISLDHNDHIQPLSNNDEPFLEYGDLDNAEKRAAIKAYLDARAQVLSRPLIYAPSAHAVLAQKAKSR